MADHAHDVEKYLLYIKNNLKMITPMSSKHKQHNGLLTYILRQLCQSKNTIFQRYIQDMHIDYQEGKLPKYTPFKLIQECEKKKSCPETRQSLDHIVFFGYPGDFHPPPAETYVVRM
jgi:hypothetical protein